MASYKIGAGDTIVFRDLGVHYPWKTEYLFETILLLSSYLLFYTFQEVHRPSNESYLIQRVMLACWILPYALALLETIILPSSKRLAPFALTLKVALPHSLLAMITSYFVNGPQFNSTAFQVQSDLTYGLIGTFVLANLLRFLLHLSRRQSIPYDFTYIHAFLEVLAWSIYFSMLQFWLIGIAFVGFTIWKHYIYWRIRSDNS